MILNTFNFINIIFSKILKLCLFWRNFFSFLENIFKNFKWLEQLKILVKQFPSKGVVKQFPPKQHNIANRHAQSIAQHPLNHDIAIVLFNLAIANLSLLCDSISHSHSFLDQCGNAYVIVNASFVHHC